MRMLAGIGFALLGGCAATAAHPPPPTAGTIETIRYETGPCFGACPVYTLTVSSDGRGTFAGRQHTAATGSRQFTVSKAGFEAFRRRLAPYRPAGERLLQDKECNGRIATDLPSVDVRWTGGKGPESHLYAYFGCDMERNAAMFQALQDAPKALPIAALIGR